MGGNAPQKVAICYIIRNGIEVVSSYLSFAPFREMSFDQVCRLWALRHDMVQFANNHPHVFLFRHEWFQHPQQFRVQLTAAFSFVGLEYDIECDKPVKTVFHPTVFAGESREAASDISRRNERWKYWSSNQREIFVETCGEAMHAQGYQIPWL